MNPARPPLLEVRDLRVQFRTRDGIAYAVNGASLRLEPGEALALLGESGSGKSVTAQAVLGVLDQPPARVIAGEIRYQGRDLLRMSTKDRQRIRGREIAMIFQDSLSALNPVLTVGAQIGETLRVREGMSRSAAHARAVELMDLVHIPDAAGRAGQYPHQFSGGLRQRVLIAMALALDPSVLIADEPTTALDVTVQAQIMDLLAELRRERGMALLLITHDLGLVASVADRIAVMYAGRVVEHADVHQLYRSPAHPYTMGLLDSVPQLAAKGGPLATIPGRPPSPLALPGGCAFHPRCPYAQPVCRTELPVARPLYGGQDAACHFAGELSR